MTISEVVDSHSVHCSSGEICFVCSTIIREAITDRSRLLKGDSKKAPVHKEKEGTWHKGGQKEETE